MTTHKTKSTRVRKATQSSVRFDDTGVTLRCKCGELHWVYLLGWLESVVNKYTKGARLTLPNTRKR